MCSVLSTTAGTGEAEAGKKPNDWLMPEGRGMDAGEMFD